LILNEPAGQDGIPLLFTLELRLAVTNGFADGVDDRPNRAEALRDHPGDFHQEDLPLISAGNKRYCTQLAFNIAPDRARKEDVVKAGVAQSITLRTLNEPQPNQGGVVVALRFKRLRSSNVATTQQTTENPPGGAKTIANQVFADHAKRKLPASPESFCHAHHARASQASVYSPNTAIPNKCSA
jgi:hypothetical protein